MTAFIFSQKRHISFQQLYQKNCVGLESFKHLGMLPICSFGNNGLKKSEANMPVVKKGDFPYLEKSYALQNSGNRLCHIQIPCHMREPHVTTKTP